MSRDYTSMIKRGISNTTDTTSTGTAPHAMVTQAPAKLNVDTAKESNSIYGVGTDRINNNTNDTVNNYSETLTDAIKQQRKEGALVNSAYGKDMSRGAADGSTYNGKSFNETLALTRLADKLNNIAWWQGKSIGSATSRYGNTHPDIYGEGNKGLYGNIDTVDTRLNDTNESTYKLQQDNAANRNNMQELNYINLANKAGEKKLGTVEYNSEAMTQLANAMAAVEGSANITMPKNTNLQQVLTDWQTFFKEHAAEQWARDLNDTVTHNPTVGAYMANILNTTAQDWTTTTLDAYIMNVVDAAKASNPGMSTEQILKLYTAIRTGVATELGATNLAAGSDIIAKTGQQVKAQNNKNNRADAALTKDIK